jgi:hypothetical protein
MTRDGSTEIDLRLIVCEIINWAELTQDHVYVYCERNRVDHPGVCLPDKCEVTSHRIPLGQNFSFPSVLRLQQRK